DRFSMEPRAPDRAMITALFSIPRCFPAIWPARSRARPRIFIASTSRVSSRDRPGICSNSPRLYESTRLSTFSIAARRASEIFLFEFLQPAVPLRGDRRLERHAQVLRQDRGEEGRPRPELLATLLDVGRREVPDVDLAQDERDRLAGELALLVREQERARDVVV